MGVALSRLHDFGADQAAGNAISDIKVDAEFDQIIASLNRKVQIKATAPGSPADGDTWIDTSVDPPLLKVRDATNTIWDIVARFVGKGADVASATSIALGDDGGYFDITGTTTIQTITIKPAGTIVALKFDGILTLEHNTGNLKLGSSITTAANDHVILASDGSNWWLVSKSNHTQTIDELFRTDDWLVSASGSTPTNFTDVSATYNDKVIRVSSGTAKSTGGADTHTHGAGSYSVASHTHTVSRDGWGNTATNPDPAGRILVGNGAADAAEEAANATITTSGAAPAVTGSSSSESNVPAYVQIKIYERD